jgi:hypothetical protein
MTTVRIIGFIFFVVGTAQVWRDAKRESDRKRARLERRYSAFRRHPDHEQGNGHCEQDSGDS